jgi:hypothetical protein
MDGPVTAPDGSGATVDGATVDAQPRELSVRPCPASAACGGVPVALRGGPVVTTGPDGRAIFPAVVGPATVSFKQDTRVLAYVDVTATSVAPAEAPAPAIVPSARAAIVSGRVTGVGDPADRVEVVATREDAHGASLAHATASADGSFRLELGFEATAAAALALWARELGLDGSPKSFGYLRIDDPPAPATERPGVTIALAARVSSGARVQVDGDLPAGPLMVTAQLRPWLERIRAPFATSAQSTMALFPIPVPLLDAGAAEVQVTIGGRTRPGEPEGGGTFHAIAGLPLREDIYDMDPIEQPIVVTPEEGASAAVEALRVEWTRGIPGSYQRVDLRCQDGFVETIYVSARARSVETFALAPELGARLPPPGTSCTVSVLHARVDARTWDELAAGLAAADARTALGLAELVTDAASAPRSFRVAP